MLRVITANVNGIRSASRKNFFSWVASKNADVICLQEVKAFESQLNDPIFTLLGYQSYFFSAQKGGYSGVAVYSRYQPLQVIRGLGWNIADEEGRYLQLDFGNIKIASLYLPSGTSGDLRQEIKYDFLEKYQQVLLKQISDPIPHIICGDFNIAHQKIDLKNWQSNQKTSGFLPKERAWLDLLFGEIGFIDAYRFKNPDLIEYTWWSNFGNAWANNVGWRIDYHVISPQLKEKIIGTEIYRGEKFSDHAPVIIDYNCKIEAPLV